jgi:hypothetical protein
MVDYFALALSHALLAAAAWRLSGRGDLDRDPDPPAPADDPVTPSPAPLPGLRIRA